MSRPASSSPIARNKKAGHHYELLEFIEAGISLAGSEVKSVRAGHVSFHDAYVIFRNGEAFLVGVRIAPYTHAGYAGHEPDRERRLLLHQREIQALAGKVDQKGLTVVPVNLHLKAGRIKVDLALARGKKVHDQRDDLKQRAERRDLERELMRR